MQLSRCPICHARISLDAVVSDEAGRELLGILAKLDTDSGTALVGYLSLFRSPHRDLANDKALHLAREALALGGISHVAQAMRQTVESLRDKNGSPLKNHTYLKKVLADVTVPALHVIPLEKRGGGKESRTAQALNALSEFGNGG